MARVQAKPDVTRTIRVSTHIDIETTGDRELALISTSELTYFDWSDIVRSLHELVDFDIENFQDKTDKGQTVNYSLLLEEAAASKGWISPQEKILVALTKDNNFLDLSQGTKSLSRINLYNSKPIKLQSVTDKRSRKEAIEQAKIYLEKTIKPVITFIESVPLERSDKNENQPENENDETIMLVGSDSDNQEEYHDALATLRAEVTTLKNDNKDANHQIKSLEQIITELTQTSEANKLCLEQELMLKNEHLNQIIKQKCQDQSFQLNRINELKAEMKRLKHANNELNSMIHQVYNHDPSFNLSQHDLTINNGPRKTYSISQEVGSVQDETVSSSTNSEQDGKVNRHSQKDFRQSKRASGQLQRKLQ